MKFRWKCFWCLIVLCVARGETLCESEPPTLPTLFSICVGVGRALAFKLPACNDGLIAPSCHNTPGLWLVSWQQHWPLIGWGSGLSSLQCHRSSDVIIKYFIMFSLQILEHKKHLSSNESGMMRQNIFIIIRRMIIYKSALKKPSSKSSLLPIF